MSDQLPPPINRTGIPGFLKIYNTQIKPYCERVESVFYLFKHRGYYIPDTDLELLIKFIRWCESSMVLSCDAVLNDEYTDIVVRKFLANGVANINNEPVFQNSRDAYTDKGVNIKEYRKSAIKISNFRSEVYMSLFQDILKYEEHERIRYKNDLFDAAQRGNAGEVHLSMTNKHPSIVKSDIDKALKVAICNGHNDVVRAIIHYIPFYSLNLLSLFKLAVVHGSVSVLNVLVEYNLDINSKSCVYNGIRKYSTSLYYAIENNDYCMIKELIRLRANVDSGSYLENSVYPYYISFETPLYIASKLGSSLDIVELLIESKASVDATDESLKTPLHAATQAGHIEIVKRLLDAKSDFNTTEMGSGPNTPLQIARANRFDEILMLFR